MLISRSVAQTRDGADKGSAPFLKLFKHFVAIGDGAFETSF